MFVKICANTNLEDALLAAKLGADAVGFVFAPSKRRVTAEQVADITGELPAGVEKVGVFATDDPYEVEHQVACSGLTAAQLHRPYDMEFVGLLNEEFGGELKIIQTVAYPVDAADRLTADAAFEAALQEAMRDEAVWAVLIDAAKSGVSGGLGVAFDWHHAGAVLERVRAKVPVRARAKVPVPAGDEAPRVILAGGLRPENVAEAIRTIRPWGVDVASGVEARPGRKDAARLAAFLESARGV